MTNNKMDMIRVGAAVPALKIANPKANADNIIAIMNKAASDKAGILLLPRLALTGSTCGDLFYQEALYTAQMEALKRVTDASREMDTLIVTGFYLRHAGTLIDCAGAIQKGEILGIVPHMYPAGANFATGNDIIENVDCIRMFGKTVAFGNIIFEDEASDVSIGIEIDDDLFAPVSPGSLLTASGADIILNPAASSEAVRKADYRRSQIAGASARQMSGYVFTSSGMGESVSDELYGGHCLIAECGKLLMESTRFEKDNQITYTEIDFGKIHFERGQLPSFKRPCTVAGADGYKRVPLVELPVVTEGQSIFRRYSQSPFIPEDPTALAQHAGEVFQIQANALARRLEHINAKSAVIGVSGGLDSTLALLVSVEAMNILGRPASDVTAVTMPGFGTTDRTYRNALVLMRKLGTSVKEISIADSVTQHFADIGYDTNLRDVTYENSQARERTQILMDIANMQAGLVVGTGDLSEAALGWCTFNGDHISMYNVNCDVPKTLIRHIIGWIRDHTSDDMLKETLSAVIDTPISPELLPPDESGNIQQKTEESVGPYELNDFFLYYTLRSGMPPRKLRYIASLAFAGKYDARTIDKWLRVFYRRFFSQQFKRNCVPDGPRVGTVCLSPRGVWDMPADADVSAFLAQLD